MQLSYPEFVTVGLILAPWGIEGKLKVEVVTDFPQRFAPHSILFIDRQPVTVDSTEWHKGKAIIKFSTIDNIEGAQALRGKPVEIPRNQVYPLPEGQYYHFQLIGLEVWTTDGEFLGNITDILAAESNDNYVVRGAEREILIPAIDDVVKSIDLDKGLVVIKAIRGLLA